MSDESDTDLFGQEMKGVTPIKNDKANVKRRIEKTPGQIVRRSLAEQLRPKADPLASSDVPSLRSNDYLDYKRDGVQHGVYKNLRLGKYALDARLDLHRMTVDEARKEVFAFLSECYRYELRCVLILHGKGERNADKIATIKSHLAVWLPQIDEVLAFHSAQKHHGGTGAVYVLLKKGEKSRQANRERHNT